VCTQCASRPDCTLNPVLKEHCAKCCACRTVAHTVDEELNDKLRV